MRTYSHATLTYAVIRTANRSAPRKAALAAALGATTPDAPMLLGAAWLWTKRKAFSRKAFNDEVCGRSLFREPDAALHSALPVAAAMLVERAIRGRNSAFLLGWAGHVLADFLTHGEDARPILWPVMARRFESPVSYRQKERHGELFTIVEHATVLAAISFLVSTKR